MLTDLELAHALADAAGAAIRPYYRAHTPIETKADASPVTAADRASEAAMRTLLARHRPRDGIIGEEYGDDRADTARVWVLDPIDGTRAFVAGRPLFGTLIALLKDGVPVLGIIDQCIIGDRWAGAAGRPTTWNGTPARTRSCPDIARARLATTSPHAFPVPDFTRFERLRPHAADTLYGGDCHNYGLLASGHLDLVVEAGLQLYDWAALVPVVTGAGGAMTGWTGAPLRLGSDGCVIAAGDPALVDAVAGYLGQII